MHPRDRLAWKIKHLTNNNDIKFIKQVLLHPYKMLKHLTRNIFDDMETGNYINKINVVDVSDAETINNR